MRLERLNAGPRMLGSRVDEGGVQELCSFRFWASKVDLPKFGPTAPLIWLLERDARSERLLMISALDCTEKSGLWSRE